MIWVALKKKINFQGLVHMNERRFHGNVERLRAPGRLEMLEIERVVSTCLENATIRTVLDIGVGSGVFAEAFVGRGLEVSGIDVNPQMVEISQELIPTGHFQVGSAEAVPYSDSSFDLVFLGHVLHEADDTFKMLSEARRVAKERVVVLEWPYRQQEAGPPLAHRIKPEEIIRLAQSVGFHECDEILLTHMTLYRMTK
jgi:ubiquinone/menaquinone biosynthesis C-methylase UbiE